MCIASTVDQHREAALSLVSRRAKAVEEWHYSLSDIVGLDDQLDGHRFALLDAGVAAFDATTPAEIDDEEVFLIAVLSAAEESDAACQKLVDDVWSNAGQRLFVVNALAWLDWEFVAGVVKKLLHSEESKLRVIGLSVSRLHGRRPSPDLGQLSESGTSSMQADCLRVIGDLSVLELFPSVPPLLSHSDLAVRIAASEAIVLRHRASSLESHNTAAVECLMEAVYSGASDSLSAARMLMSTLDVTAACEIIQQLGGDEASARLAVQCAGWLGIPDSVPWLLQMMSQPAFARVAGESFYRITGLRLDQRPYEGDWPDGFEAGPNDDPEDENVEMDEDENLPWPEVGPIAEWWEQNRSRFKSNVRYLLGFELDNEEWLRKVLVLGRQRERATAALELAIRNPTEPLFNVEEHGRRQMKKLGIKRLPTEEYRCNHIEAGPDDHTWKKYLRKKK